MYHSVTDYLNNKPRPISVGSPIAAVKPINVSQTQQEYDGIAGNLVLKLVSILERIEPKELTGTSRGKADICLARQVAMYLMHTVFSVPYHRVADFMGRDRTTISHACKLVEDLRDNQEFDKRLEAMENLLVSARALSELADRQKTHD